MFYSIVRGMLSILIWLFFKFRVFGEENVPKEGGVIIASNHASYFDIPFLACGIARRADFVAKSELFNNRIFGWILKRLGTFPVKRGSMDRWAISETIRRLGEGRLIVIYPEGARSKDGRLADPKRGIGMVVALSGARVIPSFIMGTDTVLPRGARRIRLNPVRLYLGSPLDFSCLINVTKGKELYAEISEKIMMGIGDLEAKAKGKH